MHLDLHLNFSPDPTEIFPYDTANTAPHWVVTATEFQINSYDFTLWDNNSECKWDSVVWQLEDSVTWVLEPRGTYNHICKVYVLNRVEDTVWLNAHVYNQCDSVEGVERRYWFLSSFYGTGEDNPSTDSEAFGFSVAPNPNNGLMTLNFTNLTGKIGSLW